jgi:hypothetical protein
MFVQIGTEGNALYIGPTEAVFESLFIVSWVDVPECVAY